LPFAAFGVAEAVLLPCTSKIEKLPLGDGAPLASQLRTRTEFAFSVSHAMEHGTACRQLTMTVDLRDWYPAAEKTTSI